MDSKKLHKSFFDETLEVLKHYNKDEKDIRWVGCKCEKRSLPWAYCFDGVKSWEEFKNETKDLFYTSWLSSPAISPHLVVVGDDWWLERHYDTGGDYYVCKEWWEFKTLPKKEDYIKEE